VISPTRTSMTAVATAATLAAGLAGGLPAATGAATVKAPRSGKYEGATTRKRPLTLYTTGKAIDLAAFQFDCKATVGKGSLNDIRLRKSAKGYRFAIRARGSISFTDEGPDENAAIAISGRFSRDGKTVRGVLRVKSHRCGDTRKVRWSARR
jgi:hypothetical protein